eukprot:scaffold67372_cov62-Phaeocystis_antarctica.AAC.5
MISALISYLQTPRSKNAREGRGRRDARPEVEGEEQEGAPSSKSGYVCACRCTCAVKSWHQRAQISQPSPWLKEGSHSTPVRNKHPLQNLVSFPQHSFRVVLTKSTLLEGEHSSIHSTRGPTAARLTCTHLLLPPQPPASSAHLQGMPPAMHAPDTSAAHRTLPTQLLQ